MNKELMRQPREIDKRTKRIKIYLSKKEIGIAKRQARDLGLSVPGYLRMLIYQQKKKRIKYGA